MFFQELQSICRKKAQETQERQSAFLRILRIFAA
jgi:hypothetical protein